LSEFRDGGFLQEVNRQFFHPLGLALAINVNLDELGSVKLDDTTVHKIEILDCRDDKEGFSFDIDDSKLPAMNKKQKNVEKEWAKHTKARKKLLGSVVQKIPNAPKP